MAILKPIPGSPSRFSLGMRQSSKMRLAVDEARMPSLSSFLPSVSPGVGMGTRKALIPCKAPKVKVTLQSSWSPRYPSSSPAPPLPRDPLLGFGRSANSTGEGKAPPQQEQEQH